MEPDLVKWSLCAAALLFVVVCIGLSVLACWGVWWVIAG